MATTLATEKQADAIRRRMAEIRTELPYHADAARADAEQLKARAGQLTDWKYHLSRHPLPVLAAVAAVGYLVVPRKVEKPQVVVHRNSASGDVVGPPEKRGLVSGIVGFIATLALKQASSLATKQISSLLSKRGSA